MRHDVEPLARLGQGVPERELRHARRPTARGDCAARPPRSPGSSKRLANAVGRTSSRGARPPRFVEDRGDRLAGVKVLGDVGAQQSLAQRRLRVGVDQEGPQAPAGQRPPQMMDGGGLADPALSVQERDGTRHGEALRVIGSPGTALTDIHRQWRWFPVNHTQPERSARRQVATEGPTLIFPPRSLTPTTGGQSDRGTWRRGRR